MPTRQRQIRCRLSGEEDGYPMKNVLEYLEQTAERFPEKRAVTDPEGSLTFSGLLEKARKAGAYLARYTSPGQPVGIYMSKSKDAYAAMLGIVYAGCFSVFLNTEQGTLRLRKMVETSGLSIVLTDRPGEAAQTFCPEARMCPEQRDEQSPSPVSGYSRGVLHRSGPCSLRCSQSASDGHRPALLQFHLRLDGNTEGRPGQPQECDRLHELFSGTVPYHEG